MEPLQIRSALGRERRVPLASLLVPVVMTLACLAADDSPKGKLVIVGGGATPTGLHRQMLDLAGGTNARVLVIAHASKATNAGVISVEAFRKAGAVHVANLTTTNQAEARGAVRAAEVIWFPGGSQSGLMSALNRLALTATIREHYANGAVIGGTSAGAAVMSKMMITGSPIIAGAVPPLAEGLGLWPEVIVDQHFSQRKREPRLRAAVAAHPALIGVGVDESTYVTVAGGQVQVGGSNSVSVFHPTADGTIDLTVFKAGGAISIFPSPTRKPQPSSSR